MQRIPSPLPLKNPYPAPPAVQLTPRNFLFLFFLVFNHRCDPRKTASAKSRCRLPVPLAEVQRQFLHLVPVRPAPVPEVRAFANGKRDQPCGTGVGANHQQIRLAISGRELSMQAIPAQVCIAHRSSVLHIQLAHDSFVSIRTCRRLNDRGTSGSGIALPLSYVKSQLRGGTRTRNPLMDPFPTPPVKVVVQRVLQNRHAISKSSRGTNGSGTLGAFAIRPLEFSLKAGLEPASPRWTDEVTATYTTGQST